MGFFLSICCNCNRNIRAAVVVTVCSCTVNIYPYAFWYPIQHPSFWNLHLATVPIYEAIFYEMKMAIFWTPLNGSSLTNSFNWQASQLKNLDLLLIGNLHFAVFWRFWVKNNPEKMNHEREWVQWSTGPDIKLWTLLEPKRKLH